MNYTLTAYVDRQVSGHYTWRLFGHFRSANSRADAIERATRATAPIHIDGCIHLAPVGRVVVTDDHGCGGGMPFLSSGLPAYTAHGRERGRPTVRQVIELDHGDRLLP